MVTSVLIAFFIILITLCIKPYSDRWLLPYPLVIVALGFICSEILVYFGFDTGVRYDNFYWISSHFFIPILVFNTALSIKKTNFKDDLIAITFMVLPVFLLTFGISAVLLYFIINHATGFPWIAAFLTASLLAGTQAHAIIGLFRYLKVPPRLLTLLESESLFSELLSIILFSLLLTFAQQPHQTHALHWLWQISWQIGGGLLLGWLIGYLFNLLLKQSGLVDYQAAITVILGYGAFLFIEDVLHASGALAIFVAILQLHHGFKEQEGFVYKYWEANTLIAILALFLLLGVTITTNMFSERWLAMLIGILAVLVARFIGILGGMSILSVTKLIPPINAQQQTLLALSGTRGAVAIALAFMIPESLHYWWTIQSITFGVVLFTIFIQAPLAAWWFKWTHSDRQSP